MNYVGTLIDDADLDRFLRFVAPLADDAFGAAPDDERHRRVAAAIEGVGLDPAKEPGAALTRALGLTGAALERAVHMVTFYWPSSFVWQRRRGDRLELSGIHFAVHAETLRAWTGSRSLVTGGGGEERVVMFHGQTFRRFSWLTAAERAALREDGRPSPDALPASALALAPSEWSPSARERYAAQCLAEAAKIAAFARAGAPELAYVAYVDNADWSFE